MIVATKEDVKCGNVHLSLPFVKKKSLQFFGGYQRDPSFWQSVPVSTENVIYKCEEGVAEYNLFTYLILAIDHFCKPMFSL